MVSPLFGSTIAVIPRFFDFKETGHGMNITDVCENQQTAARLRRVGGGLRPVRVGIGCGSEPEQFARRGEERTVAGLLRHRVADAQGAQFPAA